MSFLEYFRFVETFSLIWFVLLGLVVSFVSYIVDKEFLTNTSTSSSNEEFKETSIFEFWFATALSFGFLFLISDPLPLFLLLKKYILWALLLIPFYILGGVCWGVIKWKMFLLRIKNKYIFLKNSFLEKNSITSLETSNDLEKFKKLIVSKFSHKDLQMAPDGTCTIFPRAFQHKSMISSWMVFWVQSLIFTIIYNSTIGMFENFKVVFERIRIKISKYLDAMSIDQFEKINEEIGKKH